MCFSATASFGAGAVLTIIGIASVRKSQSSPQLFFASIPLIFAVQQVTEGFLWLSLTNPAYAYLQQVTTYVFLFFAQVVWPVWVPLAVLRLEPREKRSKAGKFLTGIGAMVSVYLGYCLISYPVEASIAGYHIFYRQDYPAGVNLYFGALYIAATILPPFFSRIGRMWMLGATVIISYIITVAFYSDYIVSVWCFFASIISMAIWAIMHELKIVTGTRRQASLADTPVIAAE